ncbi:hypothetical protein GW17_00026686, partial [Ensete ventricosum]
WKRPLAVVLNHCCLARYHTHATYFVLATSSGASGLVSNKCTSISPMLNIQWFHGPSFF